MKYKYQLHTHTSPTSKCAATTPAELISALKRAGYAGCVITNHFYHGNTGVCRELCWEDFVSAYERDYLECKREGEKQGIDVIFGIEEGVGAHNEILCYGITPELLYAHPELRECDMKECFDVMHSCGALVIQAHPYRYPCTPLPLLLIDGIEVYNHSHNREYDESAELLGGEHRGIITTSGADTHTPETVGFGGIMTDCRITDGKELVRVLKEGKYQLLKP